MNKLPRLITLYHALIKRIIKKKKNESNHLSKKHKEVLLCFSWLKFVCVMFLSTGPLTLKKSIMIQCVHALRIITKIPRRGV